MKTIAEQFTEVLKIVARAKQPSKSKRKPIEVQKAELAKRGFLK